MELHESIRKKRRERSWLCDKVNTFVRRNRLLDKSKKVIIMVKSIPVHKRKKRGYGITLFLILALLASGFTVFYACGTTVTVDNSSVKKLDLNRYLGKWYEVARFNHRFERDMQHCTATYTLQEDGTIKVTNSGMKNGKMKTSVGKAKITEVPGVLRVSFFGPFYSDYRVLMLAPDYSYALVGGSDDDYLWILSRTPRMANEDLVKIVNEVRRRGYDTEKLIWVEH